MAKPGITEDDLQLGSGLRNQNITGILIGDDDYIAVEVDIGAASGAAFDYGSGGTNAVTIISQRLPYPSTLVVYINQTDLAGGATPAAGTLSLRIDGYDQFGIYQREVTPFATVNAAPRTYIYTSKVFSFITAIEIAGTGIDSANIVDMHIGLRPTFAADDGITATVTAADWTDVGNILTETGAFAEYSFSAGDEIFIDGGTGVLLTGLYVIASRTDDDNIVLVENLLLGDVTDNSVTSGAVNTHVAQNNLGFGTGIDLAQRQGDDLHDSWQCQSLILHNINSNANTQAADNVIQLGQNVSGWQGDRNKWAFTIGSQPQGIPTTTPTKFMGLFRTLKGREHPSASNFPD